MKHFYLSACRLRFFSFLLSHKCYVLPILPLVSFFLERNPNLLVQYHNKLGMCCLEIVKRSAITSNMLNTHANNIFSGTKWLFFIARSRSWLSFFLDCHVLNEWLSVFHSIWETLGKKRSMKIFTKLFYGWHLAAIFFVCIIISRKSFKNKNTTSYLQMRW